MPAMERARRTRLRSSRIGAATTATTRAIARPASANGSTKATVSRRIGRANGNRVKVMSPPPIAQPEISSSTSDAVGFTTSRPGGLRQRRGGLVSTGGLLRFAARVGDAQRQHGGRQEEEARREQRPREARGQRFGRGRVARDEVAGTRRSDGGEDGQSERPADLLRGVQQRRRKP